MKKLTLFCAVISASLVHAASIDWDSFHCNGSEIYGGDNRLDMMFDINVRTWDGQTYVWASENQLRKGSLAPIEYWNSGAWLSAVAGDLANSSILQHQHDFFFYEMANGQSEYSYGELVPVERGVSYYLKFVIEDADDAWAYRLKETTVPPTLYYGWAEYMVDEDGTFRLLNSAIDFDGGAMVVGGGAVPEPTGGLLLLVGVAALALRRGRVFGRLRGRS